MSEFEFLVLAVMEWPTLVTLSIAFAVFLFLMIRKVVVGGVFDPLVLALVLGYSVNYAVILMLYLQGKSSFYLTFLMFFYGLVLLTTFRWRSKLRAESVLVPALKAIAPGAISSAAFKVALGLYLLLSLFIISSIGFGVFAETNRFDAARGFGGFIRVMDFLSPFIVAYATLSIHASPRRRVLKITALVLFILYAALVNGAKISVIFSIFTVFFTLSIAAVKVKIRPAILVGGVAVGLAFSVLALSINLDRNNVEEGTSITALSGAGPVVERFVYRIIASGDSSYLLLPNDVIDKISTDSPWVRFLVPFVGIGNLSKLLGYNVGDYSVGRQALLYYDPGNDISGGPTSHFDMFGYVYFGPVGGLVFAMVVALILGSINSAVRGMRARPLHRPNHFRVALLATLWTRGVLIIIEPTVAIAYMVDVVVFFTLLSVVLQLVLHRPARSQLAVPAR